MTRPVLPRALGPFTMHPEPPQASSFCNVFTHWKGTQLGDWVVADSIDGIGRVVSISSHRHGVGMVIAIAYPQGVYVRRQYREVTLVLPGPAGDANHGRDPQAEPPIGRLDRP